jgi:hypothetical protein
MKFGDNPILSASEDCLDRGRSISALARLLSDRALDTPMVVGIQGDWGSGKTSVMRCLSGTLGDQGLCVWFDAWRHGTDRTALWRGIIGTLVEAVRAASQAGADIKELDAMTDRLYRCLSQVEYGRLKVDWGRAVPWVAGRAVQLAGLGFVLDGLKDLGTAENAEKATNLIQRNKRERYQAQVTSVEQFHQILHCLIQDHILTRWPRLYIFVDDLDRCLPDVTLELLEAIKLFFDTQGAVFVLGMDRRVVAEAVRARYRDLARDGRLPFEPAEYIEKIVQIPFTLPPLSRAQMESYVERWCETHERPDIRQTCARLIAETALANPRGIKRTLNLLHLNSQLWQGEETPLGEAVLQRLAKTVILQVRFPDIYREVLDDPILLRDLETTARSTSGTERARGLMKEHPGLDDLFKKGAVFAELNDQQRIDLLFPGGRSP